MPHRPAARDRRPQRRTFTNFWSASSAKKRLENIAARDAAATSSLLGDPSSRGKDGAPDHDDDVASETTPLISSASNTPRYDGDADEEAQIPFIPELEAEVLLPGEEDPPAKSRTRWPSIIAVTLLTLSCVFIAICFFIIPARVKEYAEKALVVEPTSLSLEAITENGVQARVQATVRLDSARVHDRTTRHIGQIITSIVREVGTDETTVSVYLPDFDGALAGTAALPPLTVSIVDGQSTQMDIVTDLAAGDVEAIRVVANQWLEGKLDHLRMLGKAYVPVRSGRIPLGNHSVSEPLVFEGKDVPAIPSYEITGLNITDVREPWSDRKAIGAHVVAHAKNSYPVDFTVPSLGFEVLVPNCNQNDERILIADAATEPIHVQPKSDVLVEASGIIRELPGSLTKHCPNSNYSPLDHILERYLHGDAATFYVRGRGLPDTPRWIGDIMSSVTVPVAFPGRSFENVVRNLSLTDVEFQLPDPLADPEDPNGGSPLVSGMIEVIAAVPREMNFEANVTSLRASADVFYKKKKLGELNLDHWQAANSTRVEPTNAADEATLLITSRVKDVPLTITDGEVFADVIAKLLFGDQTIILDVKASVDGKINTALGDLVIRDIPTEGSIPVKPVPGGGLGALKPTVSQLKVVNTSWRSIEVEALVNITNPTEYTAHIPYINIHIYKNGSAIGDATAQNLIVTPGYNTNLKVRANWDPLHMGGEEGHQIGRDLISQYLSGYNVSIVAKTHRNSIPSQPIIGDSLSKLNVTVAAPALDLPGETPEEREHFIRDATFHLFSSTATFTLVSPLTQDTIWLEKIDAVALYNHTEPVGYISYDDEPFPATPGASRTPRLPVDWSLDSVGYDKLTNALGGHLKLDAKANVTMRVGRFVETVWYEGRGIGASVRL